MVWDAPIALTILAFFWLPSQGIAFALTWILMGHGLKQRLLTMFGVASLLVYLIVYYYQLDVPLLQKSLWLCAAAALSFLMFLAVQLILRLTHTIVKTSIVALSPVSSRVRRRIVLIVAGLALVLGAANYSIGKYERLLSMGRSVILELAPVDQRSLIQSDYMDLRFFVADKVDSLISGNQDSDSEPPLTDGYLVLIPDSPGVFGLLRVQAAPQPQTEPEQVLLFQVRDGRVRVVTNAYFFPEGEAQRYVKARYGEVKL